MKTFRVEFTGRTKGFVLSDPHMRPCRVTVEARDRTEVEMEIVKDFDIEAKGWNVVDITVEAAALRTLQEIDALMIGEATDSTLERIAKAIIKVRDFFADHPRGTLDSHSIMTREKF